MATNWQRKAAAAFRVLPHFRGKARLGTFIGRGWRWDEVVPVKMKNGSVMRLDPRSRTEEWAFWTGSYDDNVISLLGRCLSPGSVVLDVGAQIGFYSIALGLRARDVGGSVYSFEPVQRNFRRLRENIEANKLGTVVRPFNIALGNEEGEIRMAVESEGGASSGNAVWVRSGVGELLESNCVATVKTLDSVTAAESITGCDLMKIDIEGAEMLCFEGGTQFLRQCRPVIWGEFSAFWMAKHGSSIREVFALFVPLDYRFYRWSGRAFTEMEAPTEGAEDLLLVPREKVPYLRDHMKGALS